MTALDERIVAWVAAEPGIRLGEIKNRLFRETSPGWVYERVRMLALAGHLRTELRSQSLRLYIPEGSP